MLSNDVLYLNENIPTNSALSMNRALDPFMHGVLS